MFLKLKNLIINLWMLPALLGCHGGGSGPGPQPGTGLLPLAQLVKNPYNLEAAAPDGKRSAKLLPAQSAPGRLNVFVCEGGTTRQITHVDDRDIEWLAWVSRDRIVYLKDPKGEE